MKIAVMGAGAVGCYYGAMLASAGHQLVMVGRPAFVDAVSKNGLILEKAGKRQVVAVEPSCEPSSIAGADMVLVCVKSGDTEQAGQQIAPYLGTTAQVLSLQNGISNADTLSRIFGRPAMPVVVYVATRMMAPGVVRHEGRGELELSRQGSDELTTLFNNAGIQTLMSDDVMSSLWAKLIVNCALNPLSAITRLPYGKLIEQDGVEQLMEDIASEVLNVAQAEGMDIPDTVLHTIRNIPVSMPGQYSSTAQDIMRGRATEIDFLNGEVVQRAGKTGTPVPINRTLTLLVKLAENAETTRT